jgi:peptide/nickel transport system substrate-binding protein
MVAPLGRAGNQREPNDEEDDDVSRRRSFKLLSVAAAASLIVVACGDDDDDGAVSGDTSGTTADGTEPEETTGETGDTEPEETTGETDGTEPEGTEPEGTQPPGAEDVGVEGGSGCGIPHGPYEDDGTEPTGEVRVAWNQAPYSFNQNTNRGNATANANPRYLMIAGASGSGFNYYDENLDLINNDQFGTCIIDSLDPLTVTYTINEGVTWSDGTPVDAADMLIEWAAQSGVYNDAQSVVTEDTGETAQADENGEPIVIAPNGNEITSAQERAYAQAFDPETGAIREGYTYKESTGISFDTASESLELVTQIPEISEDGRSLTATWDEFYVDYQTAGIVTGVPAHVVGQNALGIADPMEAKAALIEAFQTEDTAAIKPISETYNTYFDATSLPEDPGVYAGYGPYNLVDFTEDGTMTFEAREDYTWGPQPHVQTIVYSIIGDPVAAVQAMENEEIDVIQPQATADLLTQLEGIADRGIEVIQDDGATYEHIDLAQNNGGPFDPAAYGGDAEKALAVRQAFLHAVPRQDIVDRLIIPLNENAIVRNAQVAVPGEEFYDRLVAENGSDEYAEVDIELAQQILADAGIDTSTPIPVRLLTDSENPRRQSTYELLRESVAQAGFDLVNASRPDWGESLANTTLYDATLFGWQTTAIAVADSMPNYVDGGLNNFYGYNNPRVNELGAELNMTADEERQEEILIEVEQNLFADAFGLPLYQHPQITAYNTNYVDGVSNIAIAPTVFYNVWDWTVPS